MPKPKASLAPLAAILVGLVGLVGLAGCTSKPDTTPLPDGTTLVSDAAKATRDVTTAHVILAIDGQVGTLPLRRAEGDLKREGDAKGSIQLSQFGTLVQFDFVLLGGSIWLKGATGGWQALAGGTAALPYDPSAVLDPDRGVPKLLATSTEATTEAKETVDGKETYRVGVKIDSAAASTLVPGVGPGITGKLWLDTQTKLLVKAVLTVPGATPDKPGTVTLSISAINVPVTISAP